MTVFIIRRIEMSCSYILIISSVRQVYAFLTVPLETYLLIKPATMYFH